MDKVVADIYDRLFGHFGPQNWWPANTPLEVCIGAVLTQNSSWQNVKKAITNLKDNTELELDILLAIPNKKLASLIKSSGYYNIKAKRLKALLKFMAGCDSGGWRQFLRTAKLETARSKLLSIHGIGPETADSILLYAANRPTFVIDKYTVRFGARYGLFESKTGYDSAKEFFMINLPRRAKLFNEYHALLVMLGKDYCRSKPLCNGCPLKKRCRYAGNRPSVRADN